MPSQPDRVNKIFLMLQCNGYLILDREHLWDGCDTPELDPSITMESISIRKLAELTRKRNLDCVEADTPKRLKQLVDELNASADIIQSAITEIEAKASK